MKNAQQLHITKIQRNKFVRALEELSATENNQSNIHPLLLKAQKEALISQLIELDEQIKEHNHLKVRKIS